MGKQSRQKADFLVRDLFRDRWGDVPYDPHREMSGHRMATAIKALSQLDFAQPLQDQLLRQYMNDWDDPTYGGLSRYLASVLARHAPDEA